MNRGLGQNGYAGVGDSAEVSADSALPQTLTPALSHPPVGERGTATLTPDPLELIAEGRHSVEAICRASEMSILELAAHVCTAQNLEILARVKQLHATQREMLLGRLKVDALLRLRELTDEVAASSTDEIRAAEVMRKACVDLLRYGGLNTEKCPSGHGEPGGPGGGGPGSRGYHPDSITPAFEAEVLEALERLGKEDEEQEEDVYPQITQIAQIRLGESKNRNRNENVAGYEPRARASGSVEPPPSEIRSSAETVAIRTGKMPVPPESLTEMHSPVGSISHNGPGAGVSGSFTHPTRNPLHHPRPPPGLIPPH